MKKLPLLLILLATPLLAQQGDRLLTPDGTMYSIRHEYAREHPEVETDSQVYLVLTGRRGDEETREIVPATRERGTHFNPAIAYDAQSGMLFAFWIHNSSYTSLSNQLMFASRDAEGNWSEAESFGAWFDRRENLRIAVTRRYEDEHGVVRNGLTVHLAWWQFTSEENKKSAKYTMVTVEDGAVIGMADLNLSKFIPEGLEKMMGDVPPVVTQPLLFTSPQQDSVTVVFGDVDSGTLHTVRVTPKKVAGNGGRLRVPGGKRESGPGYRAPAITVANGSRVEGVYANHDRLALYTTEEGKVHYAVLSQGEWSAPRTIRIDEHHTNSAVVDAIRRLVSEQ